MFSKVLIANRGEIACRVISTCKRLGITTAAVYSDADEGALHVQMADEAYRIGKAPASESYLRIDRIVSAAKRAKADAVHPGYGFLSENPRLPEALEKEGIKFIGPSADAITQMGDKIAARHLAQEANVPVVPGTEAEITDDQALDAAMTVGFPLLIKAADGGGGMGIRLVEHEGELASAVERARTQALGSFGSERVYIERQITQASHVEVQIIGDEFGNVIHLFDRDCSVQRRHQKVMEESPCVKLTPKLRKAMTEAAVRLAKSVNYVNAGTLEFLVTPEGDFYFLEMNTRLQVEHPITEMITGLALVELQLIVASGEKLPITQADVKTKGHAIEARIYPEDPATLLPTAGTVSNLRAPTGENVRFDSALYEGYEVSSYYEPMMAKLIVWAEDRPKAIEKMMKALKGFTLDGVVLNTPLVASVLSSAAFASAKYDTKFLERLVSEPALSSTGNEFIASIAVALAINSDRAKYDQPSRWKLHGRRQLMVNRLSGGVV